MLCGLERMLAGAGLVCSNVSTLLWSSLRLLRPALVMKEWRRALTLTLTREKWAKAATQAHTLLCLVHILGDALYISYIYG